MPSTEDSKSFDPRKYMKLAIDIMKSSIQEYRTDKKSPLVGAVLIKPDGKIETAYRGELREGDHAEFTLLERKNRDAPLDDAILFATLEPCAPGARNHPKLSCAERIVNARIKKVWVGIEDPDPTVDRKGIKYLIDNNIEVFMFDADLQKVIRQTNKQFIKEAEERAKQVKENILITLSEKENVEIKAFLEDLSKSEIDNFIDKANLDIIIKTDQFNRIFSQLGFLEINDNNYLPTGIGLLLFGIRPQLLYPNALIRATYKTQGRGEELSTFEGPITSLTEQAITWFKNKVPHQILRSSSTRQKIFDFPLEIIRETITNAVVHRDYDIEGAPIYFEITDNEIIIKSPGEPVKPLKLEQFLNFNAPSLSRNPKIMYAFDQLELVEQRGLGFQTIKDLTKKYGLQLPLVSYDDPYIIFTFSRSKVSEFVAVEDKILNKLSIDEINGYKWIKTQQEVSSKDYAKTMGWTQRTASRHLVKMLDLGLLDTNNESNTSPNLRYSTIK